MFLVTCKADKNDKMFNALVVCPSSFVQTGLRGQLVLFSIVIPIVTFLTVIVVFKESCDTCTDNQMSFVMLYADVSAAANTTGLISFFRVHY